MSLWKIAWRSIQQRSLASVLTAVSMGLGVALVVAVLVIHAVVDQSFHRGGEGYDLLVGDKGGELELVLNAVYYLRESVGSVPYSYYQEFTDGQFAAQVELAVPICMGHSFRGFPCVGTVPEMFDELTYLGVNYEFAEGKNFKAENHYDAVIGATVARETRLKLGDKFQALHGEGEGAESHQQQFNVVGILAQTGTPNDRALFVNLEGFYTIHTHERQEDQPHDGSDAHDHGDAHDHSDGHEHGDRHDHASEATEKPVTALLVRVAGRDLDRAEWTKQKQQLEREINDGLVAQAVIPLHVISKLFDGIIGNVQRILLIMAVLIVVVAGLGIMVSIYNSMSDRRHEIAVMRALGASRLTVMVVILLESILLSLGGGVLGLLLGHGLIGLLSPEIAEQTGVIVGALYFQTIELYLIPGLILLASVVGYLPAVAAYRTDVARSLSAAP